ncbi:MAG TPA: response regulator transcription factor [Fimbriimonas sp.]|nr:response regulator transcription factor [Fimbriimonas sp.]
MDKHILVVDDEQPILDAVAYGLRKEGFKVSVAMNAEACLRIYKEQQPDLLILDIMLPSASGIEICKRVRAKEDTPIILLTALADERQKVLGLEAGADDYVTKPFSVRELIARVRAVLRRSPDGRQPASDTAEVGRLRLDASRHEITIEGTPLDLSPKEFALLSFLLKNQGLVFTRQALLDRVWGPDAFVDERTVDVHVRWLRSKIEREPSEPKMLLTVRGVGYKLVSDSPSSGEKA